MNITLEVSDEELVEIAQLLVRLRKDAKTLASMPSLTAEERTIAETSPINAIKAVRERLGCSLIAAKKIVDAGKGLTP